MNKTVIGQILNIVLAWTLYTVFRAKNAMDLAYEGKYLEDTHLMRVLLSAAAAFLIIGIMIYISMKGKKIRSFGDFLKLSDRHEGNHTSWTCSGFGSHSHRRCAAVPLPVYQGVS